MLNAVKLMYAGAGLSALGAILLFVSIGSLKTAFRNASPSLTASQVNSAVAVFVTLSVIIVLIGIGLWIWMAFATKAGKNWARIVSSVFFGLYTIVLLLNISRTGIQVGNLLNILTWLAGLGAIILLWRRESTAFFQPGVIR
ncbi:MAG TPA: hypothetical protein VN767_26430 [Streptosporangiaceae bacterium]|nr:hypothetical protein [Streptosporangiaceae bacterium]